MPHNRQGQGRRLTLEPLQALLSQTLPSSLSLQGLRGSPALTPYLFYTQLTAASCGYVLQVYYTTVKDRAALNPHYGTVQVKGEFVPARLADVRYFYFQAPARTWTFAQACMGSSVLDLLGCMG